MLKIVIISFLFLVNGCFVHKGYVGEERPLEELSILKFSGDVGVWKIDNKNFDIPYRPSFEQEIKLLPGKHEITVFFGGGVVSYDSRVVKSYPSAKNSISYDFIAGRKYEIYKLEKERYGYYYGIREIAK
jgi:hypothetical protein